MRKLILIVILALENIAVAALFLVLFRSGVFGGTADATGVASPTVVAFAASPTPTRPASPIPPSPTITPAPASPTPVATVTALPPTPTRPPPASTATPSPSSPAAPSNTPARAASTAAPSSPTAAPFTPTPTTGHIGNTNGLGVWLRHSPNPNDRWVAWPDNSPMVILGPEATINGERWLQVKDPAGDVGWIQARYVVGCCYTPTPKAG